MVGLPVIKKKKNYLLILIGQDKIKHFQIIKDGVVKIERVEEEKSYLELLRGTLIKAVVQSIPTCTMSYFKLPNKLIKYLQGLKARFWWGHSGDISAIHWAHWELLCQPGRRWNEIKSLKEFNRGFNC